MAKNREGVDDLNTDRRSPITWIDSRRKACPVSEEKRISPRADCDCPCSIRGYPGKARATDLSLDGCFVEFLSGLPAKLKMGRTLDLAVKFPTEDHVSDFRIKIVRTNKHGIACEFVDLRHYERQTLQRFFDFCKACQPLY